MGEPACLIAAWLRKLVPFETSSKRTFEHCVSPSRHATASTRHATHRKSQQAPPSTPSLIEEEATGAPRLSPLVVLRTYTALFPIFFFGLVFRGGDAVAFAFLPERFSREPQRSEEHTSELQSPDHLVCRLLLE